MKTLLATIGLLSTLLIAPATAMEHNVNQPVRSEQRLLRLLERINASEHQQAQVTQILANQRATRSQLRQRMKTLRTELQALNPTASDYLYKVDSLAQRKGTLATDITRQKAKVRQQIAAVLTDQQRHQLQQMKMQWKAKRQARKWARKQAPKRHHSPH